MATPQEPMMPLPGRPVMPLSKTQPKPGMLTTPGGNLMAAPVKKGVGGTGAGFVTDAARRKAAKPSRTMKAAPVKPKTGYGRAAKPKPSRPVKGAKMSPLMAGLRNAAGLRFRAT